MERRLNTRISLTPCNHDEFFSASCADAINYTKSPARF
jgi:hypothetical protein